MKLLGLSFGTKMNPGPMWMGGWNEIFIKEALMAAEETGVEVKFIRMLDLDIKPCKGCMVCNMSLFQGGDGKCAINDDLAFVDEKVFESDGLLIGAPVYVLGPTGMLKVVVDRWGPSHDVYWNYDGEEGSGKNGEVRSGREGIQEESRGSCLHGRYLCPPLGGSGHSAHVPHVFLPANHCCRPAYRFQRQISFTCE
jgi:multimeric flavodoxin WrbA